MLQFRHYVQLVGHRQVSNDYQSEISKRNMSPPQTRLQIDYHIGLRLRLKTCSLQIWNCIFFSLSSLCEIATPVCTTIPMTSYTLQIIVQLFSQSGVSYAPLICNLILRSIDWIGNSRQLVYIHIYISERLRSVPINHLTAWTDIIIESVDLRHKWRFTRESFRSESFCSEGLFIFSNCPAHLWIPIGIWIFEWSQWSFQVFVISGKTVFFISLFIVRASLSIKFSIETDTLELPMSSKRLIDPLARIRRDDIPFFRVRHRNIISCVLPHPFICLCSFSIQAWWMNDLATLFESRSFCIFNAPSLHLSLSFCISLSSMMLPHVM